MGEEEEGGCATAATAVEDKTLEALATMLWASRCRLCSHFLRAHPLTMLYNGKLPFS